MNLAALGAWFHARTRWEKTAIAVWGAVLLFVSVRVFIFPDSRTVYPIFSASGHLWWDGAELYEPYRPTQVRNGYRYAPGFAILITPFAVLPDSIGGVLWRLFGAATFLGSLVWFVRSVLPLRLTGNPLAWLLLLTLPLMLQSLNNGQANLLVAGCMLATVAAVREERWNLASMFLAIAFLCKLYPLVLGLVLIVLYPRQLIWRMPLACAVTLLAPFLCHQPDYVIDQYGKFIALLRSEDRSEISGQHMYRDLWLLIYLYGLPISRSAYMIVQVAAGAGVAALCWHRQRLGWSPQALLTSTLALVTAWMMLLGPATESSSFALLALPFAWSVVEAVQGKTRSARHGLLWASFAMFILAVVVGGMQREWRFHEAGVHSWGSLCYLMYLLSEPRVPLAGALQLFETKLRAA